MARRVLAPVGAVALVASLTGATSGPAGPDGQSPHLASQQPPVPHVVSVPHTTVAMNTLPVPHNPPATPTAAVWPAAGDATLAVPTAKAAATAGNVPITITPVSTTAGAEKAMTVAPTGTTEHVHVADQGSARKAGVTGLLFSVTPSTPGAVSIGVNYAAFRNAGGADYGYRLHLVTLPACALTTPNVRACQTQTALPTSTNDAKANVVLATVPLTASGRVVAAVAGPTSPNGTFQASSLKPSGSWSVTGASGDFTWQYPITVPPVASGAVAPTIALGYDSQAVDGETAGTNNQTSWIGEGWNYNPGFVERTYRTCADDTTLTKADQTGDQCWAGEIDTMNLNGQSVPLVRNDSDKSFHVAADNGDRVELLNHDPVNNPPSGQYWKVTTTDGTQYFFGRGSGPGSGPTNAAWTEPVYGAHPGDPCDSTAGFAHSACPQVWRWNLDYVEDPHGNVTMYYYTPETNYYEPDNGANNPPSVPYTRGGYLSSIDYGLRDENNNLYTRPAPDQVLFTTADRCALAGTCDTPTDQQCNAGATCNNLSPTFFTTKRLTTIATRYYNGSGYTTVDSYALTQQFNNQGDPAMWLDQIQRTGTASDGSTITVPPVVFAGQQLANRVEGYNNGPAMVRWRLTDITAETGERITVTYKPSDCTATDVPTPAQNTMLCFPVYWTPAGDTNPTLDYFAKYPTDHVEVQDPDALSPPQFTYYAYSNGPAWHYDDNEVVKPANRTYGQFRGYGTVQVRTGTAPDQQTLTTTTYFLGMDGDTLPGGATRSATVTDSLGETFPDADQYSDNPLEVQVFNGDGGPRVSSTITEPTTVATTATRARAGLPPLLAQMVRAGTKRVLTDLAAGGVRTTTTTDVYDSTGRVIQETLSGNGVPTVCTATSYADDTTSWIRALPAEVTTSQDSCTGTVRTDVRTYYDDSADLGVVTGPGDTTRTDIATGNTNGTLSFATTETDTYDASGRRLSTTDARGNPTTIAYTPPDGGNLTTTVTTNSLGQSSSVTVDPARNTPVSTVDAAGHRTDATYDALGRLTAVWLPGHDKSANAQASMTYGYLLRTNGPEAVTTNKLVDTGAGTDYLTSITLYDALGQQIQTQTNAEGGGLVASDTFHDSHGWVSHTNNRYYTNGTAATTLISVADSEVDDRTVTTYDGTGRATVAAEYNGTTLSYSTQTVYGGDRTTTIPPTGGITQTTVTDALGHTVETRQYTSAPTVNGSIVSGGSYTSTTYQYDALGHPTKVTDADNNVWTTGYNMLGQTTSATSPDGGTTTYTYDLDGNLASSTDARGQTLAYQYDKLNRKTGEYQGSTGGNQLASWVWDTKQAGKLTSTTRFTPQGQQFSIAVSHYDSAGNPSNNIVSIPSTVPGLGATYTTTYAYTTTNLVSQITPAAGGGLDGNSIALGYDSFGNQTSSRGDQQYLAAASYTPFGEPAQYTLGTLNTTAWLTYDRDPQTRRLTDANLSAQTPNAQIDDTRYTYDASGNPTSTTDVQGPAGSPTETQCDSYDPLDRLVATWTANDACANRTPTSASIGGPQPFWESWSFDPAGLRTGQTHHALPGSTGGDTTTTYAYPSAGTTRADALSSATTGNTTVGYQYDADGNATTIGNQNLTWDTENHLATDTTPNGTTSYVYDADGNELLATDPNSTTLFLPGEDLTYSKSTQTVTGTRYITVNGQTIVDQAAGADPLYIAGDPHGTQSVAWDPVTQATTRRTFDPYGNQVGQTVTSGAGATGPGQWPGQRQFLNAPVDGNTSLTDIGARQYDSTTGRFISVDPQLTMSDPQALNGYTYADDNPIAKSDPTGRMITVGPGGPECYTARQCQDLANIPPSPPVATHSGGTSDQGPTYIRVSPRVAVQGAATAERLRKLYEQELHVIAPGVTNPDETPLNTEGTVWADICDSDHHICDDSLRNIIDLVRLTSGFLLINSCAVEGNGCGTGSSGIVSAPGNPPITFEGSSAVPKTVNVVTTSPCNSFSGSTPVLMADGTSKPIDQVKVGDTVANAIPGAPPGLPDQHHTVTAVQVTHTDHDYTDVTVDTGHGPATITGTAHHLYWDATTRTWTEADHLRIGDRLQTTDGVTIGIIAVRGYTATMVTYNLTIDGLHTYFVEARNTPVLVHNCGTTTLYRVSPVERGTGELDNGLDPANFPSVGKDGEELTGSAHFGNLPRVTDFAESHAGTHGQGFKVSVPTSWLEDNNVEVWEGYSPDQLEYLIPTDLMTEFNEFPRGEWEPGGEP